MNILIIAFGMLMFIAGIVLITNPEIIFKVLRDNAHTLWLQVSAIVVRLVLGILLIVQASVSKFPVVIDAIGWIAIFTALMLTVIGRKNFKRLVTWAFSLMAPLGRIAGVFALCFGSFLVYALV